MKADSTCSLTPSLMTTPSTQFYRITGSMDYTGPGSARPSHSTSLQTGIQLTDLMTEKDRRRCRHVLIETTVLPK